MDTSTGNARAFHNWTDLNGKVRSDVEVVVHNFISKTHPDYHVTRTVEAKCDLWGFAAAGYAVSEPHHDKSYDATRTYKSEGPRLENHPGKLVDTVSFGRWTYTWQGRTFTVYAVSYINRYMDLIKLLYILSPKDAGEIKDGHHADTDALLMAAGAWTKELHEEIYVFDNAQWQKDKALYKSVQKSSWDDVILEPTLKANMLDDVLTFFDNRELYRQVRVPWRRGVILHGVPGNGKTISIKALIRSLAERAEPIPSLYVKTFEDQCRGPQASIQRIFKQARHMAPCLLIFEDLDSLVTEKTRSYFLNEVDGLESNEGILMIGSTNHLDRLDSSITKRPSRFDRKYHFKVPATAERLSYARFWKAKLAGSRVDFPDDLCHVIAAVTEEFSFAYLKELFVTSLLSVARSGQDDEDDVVDAAGSDSGSSGDTVVVERPAAAADAAPAPSDGEKPKTADGKTEDGKADAAPPAAPAAKKPLRAMPKIDIPEHLAENELLKVVLKHAKILLEDMDNADASGHKPVADACGINPFRFNYTGVRGGSDDE